MAHISICIQNLGMYNEGILLFKWLDLPATEEEIDKALSEIKICHKDVNGNDVTFTDCFGCPYEEMHIPDWECDIDGIEYSEWASIDHYNEIAESVEKLSETEIHWLNAYMEESCDSFEQCLNDYQDKSVWWEGWTARDVARERADEQIECYCSGRYEKAAKSAIEWLQRYFDYDAYEREQLDLKENSDGVIEVFR